MPVQKSLEACWMHHVYNKMMSFSTHIPGEYCIKALKKLTIYKMHDIDY